MEAGYDYKVILQVDMRPAQVWPSDVPTPMVGDEVTGALGGDAFAALVVKRAWGIAPAPTTGVPTVALVITAETPQSVQREPASVQPLRL